MKEILDVIKVYSQIRQSADYGDFTAALGEDCASLGRKISLSLSHLMAIKSISRVKYAKDLLEAGFSHDQVTRILIAGQIESDAVIGAAGQLAAVKVAKVKKVDK